MADVKEIICFFKCLNNGFVNDVFQSQIDKLTAAVGSHSLVYEDFHTLFQVWLNSSISIAKWKDLGSCVIPPDMVEKKTVEYAISWLSDNRYIQSDFTKVCFLLDWLTAAVDTESIDMDSLYIEYEVFFSLLSFQSLIEHALKLVYKLTKPMDVTRIKVAELLEYAEFSVGNESLFNQINYLLSLFKSYNPQIFEGLNVLCFDDNPVTLHISFIKINQHLLARFKNIQASRNKKGKGKQHVNWMNPNFGHSSKKNDALVPQMAVNVDVSKKKSGRAGDVPKSSLDFQDPLSLMEHVLDNGVLWPSRLISLLSNEEGLLILAVMSRENQSLFSHDLNHLLESCFFGISPNTYAKKKLFLKRLALLQSTALQGIPVITMFLARYLALWNEKNYYFEILKLVEWVCPFCVDHVLYIVKVLSSVCLRSSMIEQYLIVRTLTTMYTNLVYSSTKTHDNFLKAIISPSSYKLVIPAVAEQISELCNKQLQVNPYPMHALRSAIISKRQAVAELRYAYIGALPKNLTLGLPILSVSGYLIDSMADLMLQYKRIMKANKYKNEEHMKIQDPYLCGLVNCLYTERCLSERSSGYIFERLPKQLVDKLQLIMPDVDAKLSIRNDVAFAPKIMYKDNYIDAKSCFHGFIQKEFRILARFLKTALPELRSVVAEARVTESQSNE